MIILHLRRLHEWQSVSELALQLLEIGEDLVMALLIDVKRKVAERALVVLGVLTAGLVAVLALAPAAVGIVAAVAIEAAATATANGNAVLVLGRIELGQNVLVDCENAFFGNDFASALVVVLDGHLAILFIAAIHFAFHHEYYGHAPREGN